MAISLETVAKKEEKDKISREVEMEIKVLSVTTVKSLVTSQEIVQTADNNSLLSVITANNKVTLQESARRTETDMKTDN